MCQHGFRLNRYSSIPIERCDTCFTAICAHGSGCTYLGCSSEEVTHAVTFITNWIGNGKTVTVPHGGTVPEEEFPPPSPIMQGQTWLGWFTQDGVRFDSSTVVTSDLTITERFSEIEPVTHTVTFDANGGEIRDVGGDGLTYRVTVRHGETSNMNFDPPQPYSMFRNGYAFVGWFTERDGGIQYADGVMVFTEDTTLYARWEAVSAATHRVTFDQNGGEFLFGQTVIFANVPNGALVTSVSEIPIVSRQGYNFKGWYTSLVGGSEFDFTTPITSEMTLYARWESQGTIGTPPTIITTSLPIGFSGSVYNQALMATGDAPITWSIQSGSLPPGLILSSSGEISGTISNVDIELLYTFTVKAENSAGVATRQFSISVEGESPPLKCSVCGQYVYMCKCDETPTPIIDISTDGTADIDTEDGVKIPGNSIVISFDFDVTSEFSFTITAAQLTQAGLTANTVKLYYVNHTGKVSVFDGMSVKANGSIEITISSNSYYILSDEEPIGAGDNRYNLGDVNGDGEVTIFDALEILKNLVGMDCEITKSTLAFTAAMINDPTLDAPTIFDALEVLKYLVNMDSKVK